jgi:hypothetical protein
MYNINMAEVAKEKGKDMVSKSRADTFFPGATY